MAIHLAALSWALIFILRLRFPPGKSIAKFISFMKIRFCLDFTQVKLMRNKNGVCW